jgi:hemoglobin-like flavoprotein
MNRIQMRRVRATFDEVRPCGPALIAQVIRSLREHHSAMRSFLKGESGAHSATLFATLEQIVRNAERFDTLEGPLGALGAKAAAVGLKPPHYALVREELIVAMANLLGDTWTDAVENDWRQLLDACAGAMLAAPAAAAVRKAA